MGPKQPEPLDPEIERIVSSQLGKDELLQLLDHQVLPFVASAIENLLKRFGHEENTVRMVESRLRSANWSRVIMGTITIAHWAVRCLRDCGHAMAADAASRAIDNWPDSDRADLGWFLKSRQ